MKLSEAIRLGAMLKPQGFDNYSHDGATCAFGAAFDAIGADVDDGERKHFPITCLLTVCPACEDPRADDLNLVVIHLNDDHRWTRECIADWVETLESSQSVDAVREPSDRAVSPVRV